MMKTTVLALTLFLSLSSFIASAKNNTSFSQEQAAEFIQINTPTLTLTYPDAKEGIFLCEFFNQGSSSHTLIAAFTPYAKSTHLDQHSHRSHYAHSYYLNSLTLAPQSHYRLQSQGTVIRMTEFKNPINKGDQVPITLFFSDGSHKNLMAKTFVGEEQEEG